MTDPETSEENTDYVGDPVQVGEDQLSSTPEPSDGDDDSFGRGAGAPDLGDDPLSERPTAT
jgi:hypothetical protein